MPLPTWPVAVAHECDPCQLLAVRGSRLGRKLPMLLLLAMAFFLVLGMCTVPPATVECAWLHNTSGDVALFFCCFHIFRT